MFSQRKRETTSIYYHCKERLEGNPFSDRAGEADETTGDFQSDFQTFSNVVLIVSKYDKMLETPRAG